MKLRYIPSFITLLAGAMTSLVCIIKGYDVLYSLELLLIALVIFIIIGYIVQAIVKTQMEENKKQEVERLQEERIKELEEEYAKKEALKEVEEQEDVDKFEEIQEK